VTRRDPTLPAAPDQNLLREADAAFDDLPADAASGLHHLRQVAAALGRGRLHHAHLIHGPAGSGKRHLAVRMAQLLACGRPRDAGPCRACPACRRVERGLDPDTLVLEPVQDERTGRQRDEITIEQVRRLQDSLSYRAAGRQRCVILDPADRLSLVAQEAILKTLEEPPGGVTILLVTARPSALKPTVRSRCQALRLAAPREDAIAAVVMSRAGRTAEEASVAAALSSRDLRRALGLDPAVAAEQWLDLARKLYEVLGARGESRARDLALQLAPKKPRADDAPEDASDDEDLGVPGWLDLLERILRDVTVAGALVEGGAPTRSALPVFSRCHPSGEKALRALVTRLPADRAAEGIFAVAAARADLQLRMNAKVVLTHLFLTLHELRRGGRAEAAVASRA
jgi:DNA polymerase III delta' subunit